MFAPAGLTCYTCAAVLGPYTEESESANLWCRVTNGAFFLSALGQVHLTSTINDGYFRTEARNGLQNNNGLQKRLSAIYLKTRRELARLIERILRSLSSPHAHCPIHSPFSTPL